MKDQYFGDFGDYQKISLLKTLRNIGGFKIVVHWMKAKDDGSSDGKYIGYLSDSTRWLQYDPEVFSFIKSKIDSGSKRSVIHIEQSPLMKRIKFISDYIYDDKDRSEMHQGIIKDKSCDLVFFDPDNGIEVKSITRKTKYKYLLWEEIMETYKAGKNLLVYQHFGRQNREAFISQKTKEIAKATKAIVYSIQVKHSVYFLILHKQYLSNAEKVLRVYSNHWQALAHIRKMCMHISSSA